MKKLVALILICIFFLSACGTVASSTPAAPTVAPTLTSVSTATAVPEPDYSAWPGVFFGAFNATKEVETALAHKFAIQLYYANWSGSFRGSPAEIFAADGQIIEYTWEYRPAMGPTDPYILQPLKAIVDGKYDTYIQEFSAEAREFGKPVLMRFGHEMNGDWYPWGGTRNGGATPDKYGDPARADGPELFVDAFRYIHNIFKQANATNVLWVWCPNVLMEGKLGEAWNEIGNYYPGDDYVDWLCVDGYNWGTSQSWSKWQSFDEVFSPTYARLREINPNKPIIIGETASSDKGGDKAAWSTDALQKVIAAYPQIRAIVWFHINKETDWRMTSSPAVLEAIKQQLAQPGWADTWPDLDK